MYEVGEVVGMYGSIKSTATKGKKMQASRQRKSDYCRVPEPNYHIPELLPKTARYPDDQRDHEGYQDEGRKKTSLKNPLNHLTGCEQGTRGQQQQDW